MGSRDFFHPAVAVSGAALSPVPVVSTTDSSADAEQQYQTPHSSSFSASSSDLSVMPHISYLIQLLTDLSSRLKSVKSCMLRYNGRLFDIEREIRLILTSLTAGVGSSSSLSSQLADLAQEIERLHGLLKSTLELIRANIRSSRDYVSSDLEGLRVSVRAALS